MSAQLTFTVSAFLLFIATLIFRSGGIEKLHEHNCLRCTKTWTCHDEDCEYANQCVCTQCQNEMLKEMSELS